MVLCLETTAEDTKYDPFLPIIVTLFSGLFNFPNMHPLEIIVDRINRSCTFSGLVSRVSEMYEYKTDPHLLGPLWMLKLLKYT